jgi:hypothetical protein
LTKFAAGTRVVVNGSHDGERFDNEAGVVVASAPWMEHCTLVRFDQHRATLHDGRDGDDGHHWYFTPDEGGFTIKAAAASTYLNGLDPFAPRYEWSVDPLPKFKVGDTVRLLPKAQRIRKDYGADDGATAKVTKVSDVYLWVEWLDDKRHSQTNGNYLIQDFAHVAESDRPRFMTAWIVDDDEAFRSTGDAFKTLEAAEAFVEQTLRDNGTDDQIAVFEIRSVHLARLTVTKEVA